MLRTRTRVGLLMAALLLLFIAVKPAVAQDDYGGDIDYQEFYDELDPYGQWVSDPDYGYVWIPDAGDDFRPYYSNGYWAYTDYGNTWVSNYSWGWAPFHYGRWTYHSYYGWMWIPGNVWGPAWVSWRSGGGNYGWAPLGPGISINIAIGGYSCPDYWWSFAPQRYIFDRGWHRYSYGPRYNNTYINQTTIINNTYIVNRNTYLGGPRRDDLRRAIGREPRSLAVNNVRGPQRAQVRGDRLNIYRPAVATNRSNATLRPREFRAVERPIRGNTPATASGFGSNQDIRSGRGDRNIGADPRNSRARDRAIFGQGSQVEMSGRQPAQQEGRSPDRPQRRFDRNNEISEAPVQTAPERPSWNDRPRRRFEQGQPQAQPQRSFERPQRSFEQAQPQAQPQRSFERPQRSFEQAQPQRSFERPQRRFEQAQPQAQPQRSFERPQRSFEQAQPQRSFEQPQMQQRRFEQRQQPQPQPQPQQAPGGFGGQRDGGRFGR